MSNAQRQVRVDIRHFTIAAAAPLWEEADGSVFIALDDPPPVRSVAAVRDGDGEPQALEITRVIEAAEDNAEAAGARAARGVYGRFVEASALERFGRVGTEHLDPGQSDSESSPSGETSDEGDEMPPTGQHMAVPAPVVDPDDSEPISTDEIAAVAAAAAADEQRLAEAQDAPAEPSQDSNSGGQKRGRKRRGRKRR